MSDQPPHDHGVHGSGRTRSPDTYTFGDSTTAADRLRLLAEVYASPTRELLSAWAPSAPDHAIDLGCGPGHTTRLLHTVTGARRITGIERSRPYLAQARATAPPGTTFVAGDVTAAPLVGGPADLVFARFLLTHLSDPVAALATWAAALRDGGRLIVQETAAMTSSEPALARYYELVAMLQRHHGQDLHIGRRLGAYAAAAGLRVIHSAGRPYQPPVAAMARLHALNLRTWRTDDYARTRFDPAELDDLGRRLERLAGSAPDDHTMDHTLAELVVQA